MAPSLLCPLDFVEAAEIHLVSVPVVAEIQLDLVAIRL